MIDERDTKSVVLDLIRWQSEGTHWDFKREHHKDNGDLIHDVLSLANCNHKGDRYLIFGVDDLDYSIHGIENDAGRKTQADIAALFRDNAKNFSENIVPKFQLEEIILCGKTLDILVIEDVAKKPYSLIKPVHGVRPYYIYTRANDTNTPRDDSAKSYEVEKMWRQRFGLDLTPSERVKQYLLDADWSSMEDNQEQVYFHNQFPEFTIRSVDAADYMACHEEWTRGEIRSDTNSANFFEIRYHQTLIARVRYVVFDDTKKVCVAPKWEALKSGRIYFYEKESVEYALHRFLCRQQNRDDSKELPIKGGTNSASNARNRWPEGLNIPVVSRRSLKLFLKEKRPPNQVSMPPSRDDDEQYRLFLENHLELDKWMCQRE
ncbi:MAG: ATP-binding protein, partial [Gammaproteobacteria bacterium]|nr:ATP-binding protein [Gammaproteobacteria bacterium]